jgi:SAM-dependent methyltransferase
MNPDARQTVLDTAKYLRQVRPVDPEELSEYADAHPAVVRQVLRDHAVALGLVEHDDGTFTPPEDTPVPAGLDTVRRLPARYDRRLGDLLAAAYGPEWASGESGDRLRERVRRLKEDYYRDRAVEYDREVALGYAVYHLPDFYAAVQYVLEDLAGAGLLPRHLRVLDVGAGVGGPALGLHDYLFGPPEPAPAAARTTAGDGSPPATDRERSTTAALVDYHAVEPSEAAADVLESLLDETGPNFHATVHRTTAEAFDPGSVDADLAGDRDDGYDLVLFASVLNELAAPAATVRRYLDSLAPAGTLLGLSPADRETSVGLRRVERAVADGTDASRATREAPGPAPDAVTVFGPEVRLWPGRSPTDEGWSFDERPELAATDTQRQLDRPAGSTGEFSKTAVRFSHSLLRLDGRKRVRFVPDEGRLAPMADAEAYVTERIDLAAIKLSRSLSAGPDDEDTNPVFRVGDGSQRTDHYAVVTEVSTLNRTLLRATFGAPLLFENVLALYNDDEVAYNLVVDAETVVDRLPVG